MRYRLAAALFALLTLFHPLSLRAADNAPTPQWIWSQADTGSVKVIQVRKAFEVPEAIKKAQLLVTCDNHFTAWVNGKQVAHSDDWQQPVLVDLSKILKTGKNTLAIEAKNDDGIGGLIASLEFNIARSSRSHWVVTDGAWLHGPVANNWQQPDFDDSSWKPTHVLKPHGSEPWGEVLFKDTKPRATPVEDIRVPKDFKIELIHAVPKHEQGSWVSLTVDPQGRLIASDQGNQGLWRITPQPFGSDEEALVEPLSKGGGNFGGVQGMVYAFGALYVNVNGNGSGVWRLTDTDGDDQPDKAEHIVPLAGGGEHGPHAVIVSEDGKSLYICGGNHTDPPADLTSSRVPTNWGEDLLLPRQWDARGHARGKLAPGGWVAKISPDGKQRELISIGFRNEYDIALNEDGELFTFDADMEWDLGSPWYRPTRINHVTSGSEFGWRSGTGKWPEHSADSLGAVVDIGPASPTGVVSGNGAKFPALWQRAIFALDWTYGTIWAIHPKPEGSSYRGKVEEFVSGKPLPVTDAIIGKDGAFYFAIGGRGTQSAVYRVSYTGKDSTAPVAPHAEMSEFRSMRRGLETFHGKQDPKAVQAAWQHLSSPDRALRFAARIAVESQPVDTWRSKALSEANATARAHALIALARQGAAKDLGPALNALNSIDLKAADLTTRLAAYRAYQLAFIRLGKPDAAQRQAASDKLDAMYPAADDRENRELSRLLVYLRSPNVVTKTLALMKQASKEPVPEWTTVLDRNSGYGGVASQMLGNMPPLRQIDYAFTLRNLNSGWTLDQRREYFAYFQPFSKHPGGASYQGFLENIKKEAMANASNHELQAVADLTGVKITGVPKVEELPQPAGPGKAWTLDEATDLVNRELKNRDFENGKKMYDATMCILCHRFNGAGGSVGPDLSSVSNKFSARDLLESILEPSKVISDQYESTTITKKDGTAIAGRVIYEEDGHLFVSSNPLDPENLIELKKSDVQKMEASAVSMMPPGLIYRLNKDELLDLTAYLMSGGDPKHRAFKKNNK